MVHAEVYNLPDQPLYRFDNWDYRTERSPQIVNSEDTFPAQTLLDILQVFQRERTGQCVVDVPCDALHFPGESVKERQALFAKHLSDDLANVLEVISQQADHRDHRTKTGDHRAECGHKAREDVEAAFQDGRCHGLAQPERLAAEVCHRRSCIFNKSGCARQHLSGARLVEDIPHLRKSSLSAQSLRAVCHSVDGSSQTSTVCKVHL